MTSVPFSEASAEGWLETPARTRACELLDQTVLLRSVMLLAAANGCGKSSLVGRWLRALEASASFIPWPWPTPP